ncbi:MAG: hypothetical protein IKL55_01865 [Clostridia bacterium]|nr:hypothetical protein [Clostridia bacterium]
MGIKKGEKKNGKFENNDIRKGFPKIKSSGGKFVAAKDSSKKKSQAIQEKIDNAKEVLEKEKITFKELSTASVDILTGSIKRPIYQKLESMQATYETKKAELLELYGIKKEEIFGDIIKYSRNANSSIKSVIEKEVQGIERFEQRMEPLFQSEDIDDSMSFRTIKMYAKTYIGSYSARLARTPYTLAACYQALKGNTRKQEELLSKATRASRKVIDRMRTENRKFAKETEARTRKFNEVDDSTTHYREREASAKSANNATQEYIQKNLNGKFRRKVSIRLSDIGAKRTFRANKVAEKIEDVGNWVARKAAIKGYLGLADKTAKKTIEASDYIMKKAAEINEMTYKKTDSIIQGHENVSAISNRATREIAKAEFQAKAATNQWIKHRGNSLKAKGIKLANNAITSTTTFFASNDIKISEFYARAISNLGLNEKSQEVMRNARKRTQNVMIGAENVNQTMRSEFRFSIKRSKNIESSRSFINSLKKGITMGSLRDKKGEFSSWIDEIEVRREQQKVKRKFKPASKRINVIKLLESGAQKVLDEVQGSLYDVKQSRAAAQIDLDMNPEKNKKGKQRVKSSREDRE